MGIYVQRGNGAVFSVWGDINITISPVVMAKTKCSLYARSNSADSLVNAIIELTSTTNLHIYLSTEGGLSELYYYWEVVQWDKNT